MIEEWETRHTASVSRCQEATPAPLRTEEENATEWLAATAIIRKTGTPIMTSANVYMVAIHLDMFLKVQR